MPFLCSAPGWVDSSWTSRPNTLTSRPSRNGPSWGGEPNTGEPNTTNYNNNDDDAPNDWVAQSWQLNARRTQATTRTNQSDSYYYNDNVEDYGDMPDAWSDDEDYAYATQSWSKPPPSYDTVSKPESLWQSYNMPQYNRQLDLDFDLQWSGLLIWDVQRRSTCDGVHQARTIGAHYCVKCHGWSTSKLRTPERTPCRSCDENECRYHRIEQNHQHRRLGLNCAVFLRYDAKRA